MLRYTLCSCRSLELITRVLTVFFRSLDESQLTSLGVFDGNHQRLILNKASSGITSDFENMLGDLNSVIKDLESFSVVRPPYLHTYHLMKSLTEPVCWQGPFTAITITTYLPHYAQFTTQIYPVAYNNCILWLTTTAPMVSSALVLVCVCVLSGEMGVRVLSRGDRCVCFE